MSVQFVQAKKTTLQTGISAAETTEIVLKKLVDIYDNALALSDFGTILYLTIDPGGTSEEIISATGFTVNADNTVSLNAGITRGLAAKSPYASGGTASAHAAGVTVVVSNNPQLYASLVALTGDQTIAGIKTFSVAPRSSADASAATELVRKSQLDAAVLGSVTLTPVVVPGTAGETLAVDQLVYLKVADGRWWLCDADTAASVDNIILGVTRGSGTAGNDVTSGVTIFGAHDASSAIFSANTKYFASNTAGGFSSSAGTTEVTIGFATSTTRLVLYPRYDQVITEDQQDALVGTSGTPSASNKYVTDADTTGTGSVVRSSVTTAIAKFGGDGSDGALSVTSGTTTIDCANEAVVVKQYTSISISAGATLAFSNPNSAGTIIILKSQGNVTVAGTIDVSAMGAAGGTGGAGNNSGGAGGTGTAGTTGNGIQDDLTTHPGNGGSGATNSTTAAGASSAGVVYSNIFLYSRSATILAASRAVRIACGSGGGGGGGGSKNAVGSAVAGAGGAGGRGGGGLIIECRGALDFSGAMNVSGQVGTAGSNSSDTNEACGGGGGGGGGGGFAVVLYNTLTANTGTITSSGGAGGAGGDATGGASGGNTGGAGGSGGSGAGTDGGAGGAGAAGAYNAAGANGSAGSAGSGRRAGGGGGGGASRPNSAANGTSTGGAGGAAGSSENVLVAKNYYFA